MIENTNRELECLEGLPIAAGTERKENHTPGFSRVSQLGAGIRLPHKLCFAKQCLPMWMPGARTPEPPPGQRLRKPISSSLTSPDQTPPISPSIYRFRGGGEGGSGVGGGKNPHEHLDSWTVDLEQGSGFSG